ncbi:MAG: hypothetical protein AABZ44_01950, partial [Elusimicrobiota bacterium]
MQAEAACVNAGKRLCSDDEWLRACRGPYRAQFPYSWPKDPRDRKTAITRYPKGSDKSDPPCNEMIPFWVPKKYCQFDPKPSLCVDPTARMMEPCATQIPLPTVAAAGSFARCVSPDGVYDLVGNVHEWTANPRGMFRGGFYSDTTYFGT